MNIEGLFSVSGKVALVTGGSRGIGYMIAEGLLHAGARVYICARNAEVLAKAADKLKAFGDVRAVSADLASPDGIDALVAAVGGQEKQLDILVNNAGAVAYATIEEIDYETFEDVLTVNLTAPFQLARKLLPLLRASGTIEDPARIINIASVDALKISRFESFPYGASKAGLVHLTRLMASRLCKEAITVNAICPGLFRSDMTDFLWVDDKIDADALNIPLRRAGAPSDIAGGVIYLSSPAGSWLTGVILPVSGGSATAQ